MQIELKHKIVMITGASIGIGREDAYAFAKEGCRLALTYYMDEQEMEDTAKKCMALGSPDVLIMKLDQSDHQSIKDAISQVIERFGHISILVNNAGIVARKRLELLSDEEIYGQLTVNLLGVIWLMKEALPYIKESILNIGSMAGINPIEELTVYGATKWGIRGFTKTLAKEHPELRIYTINPTITATRMRDFHGMLPDRVANIILNVATGAYNLEPGADVNIPDYVG
jgi:NAD(P)-dependent dehydrogenase (short-subunit alcohol dehydrogenase family)